MSLLPSYEIWGWVKRYEGIIEVSNRGRVRSWIGRGGVTSENKGSISFRANPKIRSQFVSKFGYWCVNIGVTILGNKKSIRVHREVGILFCPNTGNKDEVNHLNGNKDCNEWWNLQWETRIGNIGHAFRTGLIRPALGEAQSNTKLTNEMVLLIYKMNEKTKVIAKAFGVSVHTIRDIKNGRTWWHLTGNKRHIKPSEIGKYKT